MGMNGLLTLHSYRDPRTFETLDSFKKCIRLVQSADFR